VIARGDRAEVAAAYRAWIGWSEGLLRVPPAADSTWQPERMDYTFSLSTK
jgi:hypothetical protein